MVGKAAERDLTWLSSCLEKAEREWAYESNLGTGSWSLTKWKRFSAMPLTSQKDLRSESPIMGAPKVMQETFLRSSAPAFLLLSTSSMRTMETMVATAPPSECPHTTMSLPLYPSSLSILSAGNPLARSKNPEWKRPRMIFITELPSSWNAFRLSFQSSVLAVPRNAI